MEILVGTYTKKESQGIYSVQLENCAFKESSLYLPEVNPTYLDAYQNHLFTVTKDGDLGGVAYYRDKQLIHKAVLPGAPGSHVSYDEKNDLVYVSNYHGGRINVYKRTDEALLEFDAVQFEEGSKPHYMAYHPRLNEVHLVDLGLSRVVAYTVEENGLKEKYRFVTEREKGLRHLVVHPALDILYVFSELSSELYVLKHLGSTVECVAVLDTLPEEYGGQRWGAAIRILKNGKFLYVSNRAHDSISVFAISEDGLSLTRVQTIGSGGGQPRDFNISPCNKRLAVANHDSDNLVLFDIDPASGQLSETDQLIKVPEGVCVVFHKS